jgi:hypothetical protein
MVTYLVKTPPEETLIRLKASGNDLLIPTCLCTLDGRIT